MSPETLRLWQRRYEVDAGVKPGLTSEAAAEVKRLQKEVSYLREANEILKAASIFSRRSSTTLDEMIRFITEHRKRFGVELICQVLRPAVRGFLTSRGFRAAVSRAPSARQLRDELLVSQVVRLHAENCGVYGRRRMHALLRSAGWEIGRDQTREADEESRSAGREALEACVHDEARPGDREAEASRSAPVHRSRHAQSLGRWRDLCRASWIPAVVATSAARSGDAGEEVHGAAEVGVPGVARSGRIGAGGCAVRRRESGSRLPMDEAGGAVDAAEHAAQAQPGRQGRVSSGGSL